MGGYDYYGIQVPPADPEAVRRMKEDQEKNCRRQEKPSGEPTPGGAYCEYDAAATAD